VNFKQLKIEVCVVVRKLSFSKLLTDVDLKLFDIRDILVGDNRRKIESFNSVKMHLKSLHTE